MYQIPENFLTCLDDRFKEVIVEGIVSLYGITLNEKLYSRLTKNWVEIRYFPFIIFYNFSYGRAK